MARCSGAAWRRRFHRDTTLTEPTVNIFEALRRIGAKIPFRFPMVDALVPTVQFYDVSRLVSAPLEPRGICGFSQQIVADSQRWAAELYCLAPGGLTVEYIHMWNDQTPSGEPTLFGINAWLLRVDAGPSIITLPTVTAVQSIGGPPVRSTFGAEIQPFGQGEKATWANLPHVHTIPSAARIFVPSGHRLQLLSPGAVDAGPTAELAIVWIELPASFEPT